MRLPTPQRHLPLFEFTALMAMMSAITAFSIDAMLPALSMIAGDLAPESGRDGHSIIFAFFLGLGVGTLFAGPLSDRFGRRPVIVMGISVYLSGALLAWCAWSFEVLLAARVLQGLGLAGPRVASLALIRDRFSGVEMARVISLMMIIFVAVPACAPLIGSTVIAWGGWRVLFLVFAVAGAGLALWMLSRQAETLCRTQRRALNITGIVQGMGTMFSMPRVCLIIATQALAFAVLYTVLAASPQVFDTTFDRAESFALWFGALSGCTALGGYLNAKCVTRFGVRPVVCAALSAQMSAAAIALLLGEIPFFLFLAWLGIVFLTTSFIFGNLNALGLEPLGHLAGLGTSILSSCATCCAVLVAGLAGSFFDGTPVPPVAVVGVCASAGLIMMRVLPEKQATWGDMLPVRLVPIKVSAVSRTLPNPEQSQTRL